MNILIANMDGILLKQYYWEPSETLLKKVIDLSSFEGYEAMVTITQNGKTTLEQMILLY